MRRGWQKHGMLKPSRDTQRLEIYTPARRACVVSSETIKTIICLQCSRLIKDRACHPIFADIVMPAAFSRVALYCIASIGFVLPSKILFKSGGHYASILAFGF
jgi:hypothetical protein